MCKGLTRELYFPGERCATGWCKPDTKFRHQTHNLLLCLTNWRACMTCVRSYSSISVQPWSANFCCFFQPMDNHRSPALTCKSLATVNAHMHFVFVPSSPACTPLSEKSANLGIWSCMPNLPPTYFRNPCTPCLFAMCETLVVKASHSRTHH